MWSIGCIFAEMVNQKPIFQGESEIDQLMHIIKIMGTPNEETWPGVIYFPRFDVVITTHTTEDLATAVPSLDECGLDLLRKMLCVDPSRRINSTSTSRIWGLCPESSFLLLILVNTNMCSIDV